MLAKVHSGHTSLGIIKIIVSGRKWWFRIRIENPYYDYKQHKSFTPLSNSFFNILHHDFGTHCHRLVDVLLHWVLFVLVWRHIYGQRHSSIDFFSISIFPPGSRLFFCSPTMSSIIPDDVRQECAFAPGICAD